MAFDRSTFSETHAATRESCRAWLRRMRTPGKPEGYYRFSEHALYPWSLYGTNCALAVHGLLSTEWSLEERRGWARIFLDHYHPELGLFLCPMLYGDTFRGDPRDPADRRLADGAGPFKKLADKIFGLTGEMVGAPDEGTLGYDAPAALGGYFEECRRHQDPYTFGSTVGDFLQKRTLWLRGQKRGLENDPWIRWAYEYIDTLRDPRTGMVTGNTADPMLQMDGLFKLSCSAWWNHGRPIPEGRKVIDAILAIGSPERGFGNDCEDYNATNLLVSLCLQEGGYRFEGILAALTGAVYARLEARRKPDGAFSFHPVHCITRMNSFDVAPSLPESDLLGTGQQLSVLKALGALTEGAAAYSPIQPPGAGDGRRSGTP